MLDICEVTFYWPMLDNQEVTFYRSKIQISAQYLGKNYFRTFGTWTTLLLPLSEIMHLCLGSQKKTQKCLANINSWKCFFFVFYKFNFHYCFTSTLIDIYKSKHRTHFLANYYGFANSKHYGLKALRHLNWGKFLRVPNLSAL